MTELQQMLAEHIAAAARTRFDWGTANCWFFIADWVALRTGRDPAAHLRGRFHNRFGCLRIMLEEGARDWLGFAEGCLAWLPEIATAELALGDVAAISSPAGAVGAIVTGRGLVARVGCGMCWSARERARIEAAWLVGRDA